MSKFLNVQLVILEVLARNSYQINHSEIQRRKGEKPGATDGVWVQGGGIELPCKYFVCRPKKFKAQVKSELHKRP